MRVLMKSIANSFIKIVKSKCQIPVNVLVRDAKSARYKVVSSTQSRISLKDRLCGQIGHPCMYFTNEKIPAVDKMSDSSAPARPVFSLPASVRGMKVLDRDAFRLNTRILGLKVPVESIRAMQLRYKHWLLKRPKMEPIAHLDDDDKDKTTHKLFLFCPSRVASVDAFGEGDKVYLAKNGVLLTDLQQYTVILTYDNFSHEEILSAVLPEESSAVGSYSSIGHIAHLNLKDHLLDYKSIIGNVILDKLTTVKTVIHKTQAIDSTFRNFQMEVIAGVTDFITVTREHGHTYKMDFSKVYWNPRLGSEHQRIVQQLSSDDVLYDVFAGIGPFAIPAAKKRCQVFANDLNPESVRWLRENIGLNKVKEKVQVYCMDGHQFITSIVKSDLLRRWQATSSCDEHLPTCHIVMNLPSLAVDFLTDFRGMLSRHEVETTLSCGIESQDALLPVIHCYTFSNADNPVSDARLKAAAALGLASFEELSDTNVRIVRNVAPRKEMLCVSFRLPWNVISAIDQDATDDCEHRAKRSRPN